MERVNSTIEVDYDGLIDITVAGEETRFDSEDFSVHVSPEDGTARISTYVNVEHNGDDIEAITHLIIDDPSVARTLAAAIVKPFADDRATLGESKVTITDDMVRRAMFAGMNELGALPHELDGDHERAFRVALTEALKDV